MQWRTTMSSQSHASPNLVLTPKVAPPIPPPPSYDESDDEKTPAAADESEEENPAGEGLRVVVAGEGDNETPPTGPTVRECDNGTPPVCLAASEIF